MEPFAMKSGRRRQLHWWVTAVAAVVFFVWSFDLVPRIRSAATGVIAGTGSSAASGREKESDDDWSGILEEPQYFPPHSSLPSDDPLFRSLTSEDASERSEFDSSPDSTKSRRTSAASGRDRPVRDSAVAPASYAESYDTSGADNFPGDGANSKSAASRVIPADVATALREIDLALREDRILDAHAELSRIYWKHKELRVLIQERIDQTATLIFTTAERKFAEPHFVDYGETLESIAKQYDVPWMYLAMLNRVTPEKLQAGQQLKVVRGPFGAVVDLDEFCLTVHAHGWYVNRYQIGIGRDEKTPTGEFTVQEKLDNPTWYDPDGGVVDADDPENPLGEYWLGLGNHIGIHGTNDPDSIGKAASRGCIHLNDEDIAEVFGLLSVGSKVVIRK